MNVVYGTTFKGEVVHVVYPKSQMDVVKTAWCGKELKKLYIKNPKNNTCAKCHTKIEADRVEFHAAVERVTVAARRKAHQSGSKRKKPTYQVFLEDGFNCYTTDDLTAAKTVRDRHKGAYIEQDVPSADENDDDLDVE